MSEKEANLIYADTKTKTRLRKPGKYGVILLNDDYTPRDFVVWVLQIVFHKPRESAERIMLEAHTKGKSLVGIYPLDIARTYIQEVRQLADQNEYPLECRLEKVADDEG